MDNFLQTAQHGSIDVLNALLGQSQCDINITDVEGRTALMLAAENKRYDVMKVLLEAGCDVNTLDGHGITVLLQETESGNIKAVQLLLSDPRIDVNIHDSRERTPLHVATLEGKLQIVEHLLSAGCKLNLQDADGYTPVYLAAWDPYRRHQSFPILQTLTTAGADLEICDITGKTPIVASWSNPRHFRYLVTSGCDVNSYRFIGGFSLLALAKLEESDGDTSKRDLLIFAGGQIYPDQGRNRGNIKDVYATKLRELIEVKFSLMTLKGLCRIVVRQNLKRPLATNLKSLVLPRPVLNYLNMDIF